MLASNTSEMLMHECVWVLVCVSHTSVCELQPRCCDSRQNKSVLRHLIETPLTMTPLQYHSCLQLLSSATHPPPFTAFWAPVLSCSLLLSLNHPPLFSPCPSSLPIHLSQSSSSILLSVPTNLPLHASKHFLCLSSPSLHITLPPLRPATLFFSFPVQVMAYSASMFISASSPECSCLYPHIR